MWYPGRKIVYGTRRNSSVAFPCEIAITEVAGSLFGNPKAGFSQASKGAAVWTPLPASEPIVKLLAIVIHVVHLEHLNAHLIMWMESVSG